MLLVFFSALCIICGSPVTVTSWKSILQHASLPAYHRTFDSMQIGSWQNKNDYASIQSLSQVWNLTLTLIPVPQSVNRVGFLFQREVCTVGQLYVALSRITNVNTLAAITNIPLTTQIKMVETRHLLSAEMAPASSTIDQTTTLTPPTPMCEPDPTSGSRLIRERRNATFLHTESWRNDASRRHSRTWAPFLCSKLICSVYKIPIWCN